MQEYITVKEYALRMGISERAVRKQIAKGMHRVKEVPHNYRKDQVAFLIYIGENSAELSAELSAEPSAELSAELSAEPSAELSAEPSADTTADTSIVESGELSVEKGSVNAFVLPIPIPMPEMNRAVDLRVESGELRVESGEMSVNKPPSAAGTAVSTIKRRDVAVGKGAERLGHMKALFCEDILKQERCGKVSIAEAIEGTLALYNNGLIHQGLYKVKGSISERTVYNWLKRYKGDGRSLVEKYNPRRGHTVLQDDMNFLTGWMMSSSERTVGAGIKILHYLHRRNGTVQGCSDRTLRRAFDAWKVQYNAVYSLHRYGEKYVKEKYLPYIEQDWSLVKGGELWFSDGHKLNFPVLNPYTGKAERPTLVSWMDAATRFIVGFDIAFSESQRLVASSFRNGLCYAGYCPRYVKVDNGLAFKAAGLVGKKLTQAERERLKEDEEIEESMLQGALYRCGVERVSFGKPYNSTSKAALERWHRTLDTGLEAALPNYSGNSVANKPARMRRNEKFLQELERKGYLTVIETKLLIEGWILEIYGMEPHPGLGGLTPLEAWTASLQEIGADQKKSAEEYYWLMLQTEVKKLGSQGVKVMGIQYWAEEMINYVGQAVTVRYDQTDDRYVYVFRADGEYICRAEGLNPIDPLASLRPEKGLQAMELRNRLKDRNRIMKKMKKATREFQQLSLQSDDAIQRLVESQQAQLTRVDSSLRSQLRVESGELRVESGEQRVESGEQGVESGELRVPKAAKIKESDTAKVSDAIGDAFRKLGITE